MNEDKLECYIRCDKCGTTFCLTNNFLHYNCRICRIDIIPSHPIQYDRISFLIDKYKICCLVKHNITKINDKVYNTYVSPIKEEIENYLLFI